MVLMTENHPALSISDDPSFALTRQLNLHYATFRSLPIASGGGVFSKSSLTSYRSREGSTTLETNDWMLSRYLGLSASIRNINSLSSVSSFLATFAIFSR